MKIEDYLEYLNRHPSPYTYKGELFHESSMNHEGNVSLEKSIYAVNTGLVTLSDLHILKGIADLKYTTTTQLLDYLEYYKMKNPNFLIPEDVADDNYKNRMKALLKNGLVRKFKFCINVSGKKTRTSYCVVSDSGYKILNRKLAFNEKYDGLASLKPLENVFGNLAANSVLLKFLRLNSVIEVQSHESTYIAERRTVFELNHIVKFVTQQGREHKLLIEPIRYSYNDQRINKTQYDKAFEERIYLTRKFIEMQRAKSPYILFVCEDVYAVRETLKRLERLKFPYMDNVYMTVDEVVYKGGLENAFLKKDRELSWTVAKDLPFLY